MDHSMCRFAIAVACRGLQGRPSYPLPASATPLHLGHNQNWQIQQGRIGFILLGRACFDPSVTKAKQNNYFYLFL